MVTTERDRASSALLAEAALVVALSIALGNLRLVELPLGGSISFGSLPVLAFASVRGVRAGFIAGWCAGLGHALAGGTIVHPVQYLLDYGIAYAALGCAGLATSSRRAPLVAAIVLAQTIQLACFTVSGIVFFAPHGEAVGAAASYALAYNALTVVPEALLAIWLVPRLARAFARAHPELTDPSAQVLAVTRRDPNRLTLLRHRLTSAPHGAPPAPTTRCATATDTDATRSSVQPFARPPLFAARASQQPLGRTTASRRASSGTSPSAWQTTQPRPGFAH